MVPCLLRSAGGNLGRRSLAQTSCRQAALVHTVSGHSHAAHPCCPVLRRYETALLGGAEGSNHVTPDMPLLEYALQVGRQLEWAPRQPTCWASRQLALTWAAVAEAACRLVGTRFERVPLCCRRTTHSPLTGHIRRSRSVQTPTSYPCPCPCLQQCAEACRAAFPDEDFMHLAGLLAPLGKLLAHAK